ncbi:MAG TPA: GIY-YIG nuclease family protein, partial [bacterium]|nr:GIY-YIG nuclease family protein [bacterium]
HNAGRGAKYTRTRLPVALAYARRAGDRSAALRREYALKQKDRGEKLRMAAAWRRGRGRRARKP